MRKWLSLLVSVNILMSLQGCGPDAPVYTPTNGPTTAAKGEAAKPAGTPAATSPGTPAPASATKPGTPVKPPTVPPAAPPAAAPAAPPSAALIAQGTQVFNAKCAACHGALAQKAADIRINTKTAAQITAAKTVKAVAHTAVVWPVAAEITALEAVFK